MPRHFDQRETSALVVDKPDIGNIPETIFFTTFRIYHTGISRVVAGGGVSHTKKATHELRLF